MQALLVSVNLSKQMSYHQLLHLSLEGCIYGVFIWKWSIRV